MTVEFLKKFEKDLDKLSHKPTVQNVISLIEEIESVKSLSEIGNVKKMKGYSDAYRIRVGNYRIGIYVEDETILLARILHRKDIYKYFP